MTQLGRPPSQYYYCKNCDERFLGKYVFHDHAKECVDIVIVRDDHKDWEGKCNCWANTSGLCEMHEGKE